MARVHNVHRAAPAGGPQRECLFRSQCVSQTAAGGDSLNICIFLSTSHVVLHTQQTAAHTLVLKQGAHAQNVNSVLGGFIFVDWLFIFIHW